MPYLTGKDIVRNCKGFFFGSFYQINQSLDSEKKKKTHIFLQWKFKKQKLSQWLAARAPLQGGTVLSVLWPIQKKASHLNEKRCWRVARTIKRTTAHSSCHVIARKYSHKRLSLIQSGNTTTRQKSNDVFRTFQLLYTHNGGCLGAPHANEQLHCGPLEVTFAAVQKQWLMSEPKHVYEEHLLHHCVFNVFRTSKTASA